MKRYIMIFAIILLVIVPIVPMQKTYAKLVLIINPTKNIFTINGETHSFNNKTINNGRDVFVPLRETFTKIGYSVQWDDTANAVVCKGDGNEIIMIPSKDRINVNSTMYNVAHAPFSLDGNLYISTEVLQKSTGLDIELMDFTPGRYKTHLDETVIDDSMRTETIPAYGTIRMSGTRAMEAIAIIGGDDYAALISQVAALLPECNVYSMLVPTGTEYYGEKDYSIKNNINEIYSKMDDRVIPINVFDVLDQHKGENIYFRTDHHWTQRGAYYAYEKMLAHSNRTLPPLTEFEVIKKEYVGSMANFLSKTAYAQTMRNNPDEIEYFMPKAKTTATVYYDRWLTQKARDVSVVSASGGYLGYIGGDSPITVIKTDCESDRKLLIVKESYGNTIATWAVNNYREIYVVDPRHFNTGNNPNSFNLVDFYNYTKFDDALFINYPGGVSSPEFRNGIRKML